MLHRNFAAVVKAVEAECAKLAEAEPIPEARSESANKRLGELHAQIWVLEAAGGNEVVTDEMMQKGSEAFNAVFDEWLIQEDKKLRAAPGFIDDSSVVDIYWRKMLEALGKKEKLEGPAVFEA